MHTWRSKIHPPQQLVHEMLFQSSIPQPEWESLHPHLLLQAGSHTPAPWHGGCGRSSLWINRLRRFDSWAPTSITLPSTYSLNLLSLSQATIRFLFIDILGLLYYSEFNATNRIECSTITFECFYFFLILNMASSHIKVFTIFGFKRILYILLLGYLDLLSCLISLWVAMIGGWAVVILLLFIGNIIFWSCRFCFTFPCHVIRVSAVSDTQGRIAFFSHLAKGAVLQFWWISGLNVFAFKVQGWCEAIFLVILV